MTKEQTVDEILAAPHGKALESLLAKGVPQFAYYTDAETALKVLRNGEIWMRNASLMNDYSEIAYGIDRIVENFGRESEFETNLRKASDRLSLDFFADFARAFDGWITDLKTNTYLTCISVHDQNENQYGRLSMWRAYGGKNGVALIIDSAPMLRVENRMGVYSTPVFYWSKNVARDEFAKISSQLSTHLDNMTREDWAEIKNSLSHFLRIYALSMKHPGFAEEKEWRVFFRPAEDESKYITSAVECIGGLPQKIQKLTLSDEVEVSVQQLFKKLIIGPTEHQFRLAETFDLVLEELGFNEPGKFVTVSSIPLRH